jgi:hypothetical protein
MKFHYLFPIGGHFAKYLGGGGGLFNLDCPHMTTFCCWKFLVLNFLP